MIAGLFFQFAPWLIFIPLFLYLKSFSKSSLSLKTICCYLVVSTITQVAAFLLWYMGVNNMPVLHIYTILEFATIAFFYHTILDVPAGKKTILYIIGVFTILSLINSAFIQSIFTFNTYASALRSFLVIIFTLLYIIRNLNIEGDTIKSGQMTYLMINYGFLIYFSGALILFAFNSLLPKERSAQVNIWNIHVFLLVILYFFLTVAIWKPRKA